jgi:plastocyanin
VIEHMPPHLRLCARRISPPGLAALAVGLCLLSPATAGAHATHTKVHVQSGGASESTSSSSQGSTAEPPAGSEPPAGTGASTESSATATPAIESNAGTRAEERRLRSEERRARRNAQAQTQCSVSLEATPPTITAGAPLTLTGALSCPEAGSSAGQIAAADLTAVVGQGVTLYQKVAHTPGFSIAATATTEADGTFRFTPSGVDVNSVFYVRAAGARSARVSVKVTPEVTIEAPTAGTQLLVGSAHAAASDGPADSGAVTFTGKVSPADAGATVALQREYAGDSWHHIGAGLIDAEGGYTIEHTFFRAGQATVRVVVHSHGLYMNSASTPVTYEISRRSRSRQITIQASTDPIAYGLPVTIGGTVAGAAGQPVTLQAQTPEGKFAPVATGETGAGGEYSFAVSPLQSTRYRVTSAAGSADLSEGVTYALIPTPSATTVPVGESITFTGTASPAHEGQPIELERQYASGLGYHVIATGAVSASSTYSIAHTFTDTGAETLRIRVPEDAASSQIQGVASAPFELEVTPAA